MWFANGGGIVDNIEAFMFEFEVPISYVDIYHADGAWSLPHEFYKENHPYKYGYGKLMHSGYHFVDLFSWIIRSNFCLKKAKPNLAKLYTARFTPNDLFHQIDQSMHEKLFNKQEIVDFYRTYSRDNYKDFGELDAHTLIQLFQDKNVVTNKILFQGEVGLIYRRIRIKGTGGFVTRE
jgi:hypothetical protein